MTKLGEGNGTPLQYSCLENPMGGGAWQAAVRGVTKSWTRLSDFTFTFHFHALEKEMATYSSVLAWRIPGTGEPSGLPSLGLHRVGHDWSDLAAAAATMTKLLFFLSLWESKNSIANVFLSLHKVGWIPNDYETVESLVEFSRLLFVLLTLSLTVGPFRSNYHCLYILVQPKSLI